MSLSSLLAVLADGEFHSGDALGRLLGVSRTAVWKQLKKVDELALPIESIKGKGYRIVGGLDLLSETEIRANLNYMARGKISAIQIYGVIGSTNEQAMAAALAGRACGVVCIAEQQSAGRGRRGRVWVSPYARNIYLSMVWEFASGAATLEGLSLAVGVAVVAALDRAGAKGAQLKWPNDVLYRGSKLAGVLLEMVGDAEGPCHVVVGVGLNVVMPPNESRIDQPWIDVQSINKEAADRNRLIALLLNELIPVLAGYEAQGFAAYRDRWHVLDALAGKNVEITLGRDQVFGVAVGVDRNGALLLDTSTGQRRFSGGEITVRDAG